MLENDKDINIIALLMGIKEDVSSIKTDMTNFKEAQKVEKEITTKEIADVREDCKRAIVDVETKMLSKLNGIQSVQNTLVGEVDTLKHAEEKKDAKRWKTVIGYICTALGSFIVVKLPDFIAFCLKLNKME